MATGNPKSIAPLFQELRCPVKMEWIRDAELQIKCAPTDSNSKAFGPKDPIVIRLLSYFDAKGYYDSSFA